MSDFSLLFMTIVLTSLSSDFESVIESLLTSLEQRRSGTEREFEAAGRLYHAFYDSIFA